MRSYDVYTIETQNDRMVSRLLFNIYHSIKIRENVQLNDTVKGDFCVYHQQ